MKLFLVCLFFSAALLCHGQWGPVMMVYSVEASSELHDSQGSYGARNLTDFTYRSWAEGARGSGIGESFTLDIGNPDDYYYHRGSGSTIAGFALKNGYGNLDHYARNNRVRSFRIYVDDVFIETITVRDSISFEQYAFPAPVEGRRVRFVIDSVYRGTAYDDTCVAEIGLLGAIVEEEDFHENILEWMSAFDEIPFWYRSHSDQMTSVPSDEDRRLLLEFLPFDIAESVRFARSNFPETRVALLEGESTLRLQGDLPRLDGATALYPLYSAFVRAVYPETLLDKTKDIGIGKILSGWEYLPTLGILVDLDFYFNHDEFKSIVQCNKTGRAYERLIAGEADIIFCFEPSDAERRAAAGRGLTLNLTPLGADAFVFIVHGSNPFTNITQGRIRDIYSGRVTNWRDITGVDEPVIAYQRPENSGSQTILQSIMRGDRLIRPVMEGEYVPRGMFGMMRRVASNYYNYHAAIGYSFLFYLRNMAVASGVKVLSIDGVAPTREAIQSGAYPFTQTIYAITTGGESENTRAFLDWMRSPQGRELVEKTGYVPLR